MRQGDKFARRKMVVNQRKVCQLPEIEIHLRYSELSSHYVTSVFAFYQVVSPRITSSLTDSQFRSVLLYILMGTCV